MLASKRFSWPDTPYQPEAKQLEKELPWHMTPEDEKPLYVEAGKKQWDEHVFIRLLRRRQALECGGKKGRGRG
jgi:hypothetical protein